MIPPTTQVTPHTVMPDPALQVLDPATAKGWLEQGDTVLLDVREPSEHARERIPGAKMAPLSSFNPAALELGRARRIIVHCASGMRAAKAAELLRRAGTTTVACLDGGPKEWREAGYEVTVDKSAPLPIMRQVQIVAGSFVLLGVGLALTVHVGFIALVAFVGAGLVFAGVTGWCGMAMLLGSLPYNKRV